MIAQVYREMLGQKSAIREVFMFGRQRAKEIGYDNVFDFSLGNPSVPVPDAFTESIVRWATCGNSLAVHGYSPSSGIESVREKVAESLKRRFHLPYEAEHIFMTSGAAGALAHAVRAVTVAGDEVITFAPFFPEYGPYINLSGAQLTIVPPQPEDFQINFEAFQAMLSPKTMAVLVNTPNNPSGMVYSHQTLQTLADILRDREEQYGHPIYLISDEPYREIVFEGVRAPYVASYHKNAITCYSFSKALSIPGERIGYVAVNPACEDAKLIVQMCVQISRGIGHNCPPSIIQLAVADVIDSTSDMSTYETNMNILYEELIKLGFSIVKPGGTFYMFPKAMGADAVAFCKRALKHDLLLVPGNSFGCGDHFRIAYCIPTEKVMRSLDAFRKLAGEYR